MNTEFIKGIIVPILTPVDKNEVIDEGKMRKQVDFVIDGGVSGILAFGSNGEFYMTEEDEMMKALKIMLNHASGRVPVYMGIGAISTKKCIRNCKSSGSSWCRRYIGPSAHVSKPTEEELYLHFKRIADAVSDTPMLLYNNPGRTGYT